jgi:hypothetical protein
MTNDASKAAQKKKLRLQIMQSSTILRNNIA